MITIVRSYSQTQVAPFSSFYVLYTKMKKAQEYANFLLANDIPIT